MRMRPVMHATGFALPRCSDIVRKSLLAPDSQPQNDCHIRLYVVFGIGQQIMRTILSSLTDSLDSCFSRSVRETYGWRIQITYDVRATQESDNHDLCFYRIIECLLYSSIEVIVKNGQVITITQFFDWHVQREAVRLIDWFLHFKRVGICCIWILMLTFNNIIIYYSVQYSMYSLAERIHGICETEAVIAT